MQGSRCEIVVRKGQVSKLKKVDKRRRDFPRETVIRKV
jgi:hypothetical protein